jgi:hypothetical protein
MVTSGLWSVEHQAQRSTRNVNVIVCTSYYNYFDFYAVHKKSAVVLKERILSINSSETSMDFYRATQYYNPNVITSIVTIMRTYNPEHLWFNDRLIPQTTLRRMFWQVNNELEGIWMEVVVA